MTENYLTNFVLRYSSKWMVLAIDLLIISVAFVLAYFIRFNLTLDFDVEKLVVQLPFIIFTALISFIATGSYKGVVRHTGVKDVYNLFNAICLSSILSIFIVIINRQFVFVDDFTIPLSIIIIYSLIGFVALTASRYVFKGLYYNFLNRIKASKNVLIYGAGELGILTHNAITNHISSNAKVVGYIDNDKKKIGKNINGVKVFDKEVLTQSFILNKDVDEVVFSIQNIDHRKLRALVEGLVDFPVVVKIVPPVEDWINGELKASQIKQIQIEDLLERPPISIENSKIPQQLKDKVVLVTGGAGSIGSELV